MNIPDFLNDTLSELLFHSQYRLAVWSMLFLLTFLFVRHLIGIIINGVTNKLLANRSSGSTRILNPGGTKRVLLVGDSTAFGAGADRIEETLAGRFAHDYPHVEIVNYGVNGSLTRDVLKQLDTVGDVKFNLVLINTGGNDVWHFSSLRKVKDDIYEIIQRANKISNGKAILLIYNYVGLASAFPFFLRGIIRHRARNIDAIFQQAAQSLGIQAVDVFSRSEQGVARKNSRKYFAADGIHPSSEGYRMWYVRLWGVLYKYNYGLNDDSSQNNPYNTTSNKTEISKEK